MKKEVKKKEYKHPILRVDLTIGQKAADKLSNFAGSWTFIISFLVFLIIWMFINGYLLIEYYQGKPFDPYPFILLNLVLSCLAAIQAPVILMSQKRQEQRDRLRSEYDYTIDRKTGRDVMAIKKQLDSIKRMLKGGQSGKKRYT